LWHNLAMTDADRILAELLGSHRTNAAAAAAAGCSPRTVSRRLADPQFRRRLGAARRDSPTE